MSFFPPSNWVSQAVRENRLFSGITREQNCIFVLINTIAIAAIAYDRRPVVICGAVAAMLASTRAVAFKTQNDKSYASILWEALLGAGLGVGIARFATQSWKRSPLAVQIDDLETSVQEGLRRVYQEGLTLH